MSAFVLTFYMLHSDPPRRQIRLPDQSFIYSIKTIFEPAKIGLQTDNREKATRVDCIHRENTTSNVYQLNTNLVGFSLCLELGLEGGGHLGGRRAGELEGDFHGIIDEPLEGGEGTDHDDTRSESLPETSETKLLNDISGRCAAVLVELGNDGVGGMRNNGAEHSSDVSGNERHHQLFTLRAFGTRLGDRVLVDQLDSSLEAGELHHRVWDLSHPKRRESLEETRETFILHDHGCASTKSGGSSRRGLDSDLGGLHRSKKHIGEELSRRRGSEVEGCAPFVGKLL